MPFLPVRKLCFVVLEHRPDQFFLDVVASIRRFCPEGDVVWYDSGARTEVVRTPDVHRMSCSRPLAYAKVTPFFFDMFEWAAGHDYAFVVNVESDLAFINSGYAAMLTEQMHSVDYLGPGFTRRTPVTSRWRPYHSLRRELPELLDLLGAGYTNRAFSPAQVFSRRYMHTLLGDPRYEELRAFVERNQAADASFSLQEVLLATLPDVLGLEARPYPPHMNRWNRYRPYHSAGAVQNARSRGDVPFIHPVRRDDSHPTRKLVRTFSATQRIGAP